MKPDDILKVIDELGRRIGPTGQYVWRLLVHQKQLEGWTFGIASLLGLLAWAVFVVICIKMYRRPKKDIYDTPEGWLYTAAMSSIFAVPVLIVLVFSVLTILNPEYYALTDLLKTIR